MKRLLKANTLLCRGALDAVAKPTTIAHKFGGYGTKVQCNPLHQKRNFRLFRLGGNPFLAEFHDTNRIHCPVDRRE
jgi:hypothetical protein